MMLVTYAMPVLSALIFGYGIYEIGTGKDDPEKMGLAPNVLKFFGVANCLMMISWVVVLYGMVTAASWTLLLAVFITGMFFFDYIVSLAIYKNVGSNSFKYMAGVIMLGQVAFCTSL
jgi:hypothetical protein